MAEDTIKVVRERSTLFTGPSWGARCMVCGEWITKYDHSPEEALAIAQGEPRHVCRVR